MSLTFSQIVSRIDRFCKSNSSTYPLADKTADINLALDTVWATIFRAGGTWQFDDSNHTDYPIITTALVDGQRDYAFTTDENSNLILDVYKVMVADADGVYHEIYPIDVQSQEDTSTFYDGRLTEGTPLRYDKTGNGIFLDPIPSYNEAAGLKVYINREGSYFTVADTTKKAGFAGIFHEYLAVRPSYQFAFTNGLKNAPALAAEMLRLESALGKYYSAREKDVRRRMTPNVESTK